MKNKHILLVLLVLSNFSVGCTNKVFLIAPPKEMPLEQKIAKLAKYQIKEPKLKEHSQKKCLVWKKEDATIQPFAHFEKVSKDCKGLLVDSHKKSEVPSEIVLKTGERVDEIEDLFPVLDSKSVSKKSFVLYQSHQKKEWISFGAGFIGSLVVGSSIAFAGKLSDPNSVSVNTQNALIVSGISIGIAGIIASSIAGIVYNSRKKKAYNEAVSNYNFDLFYSLLEHPANKEKKKPTLIIETSKP